MSIFVDASAMIAIIAEEPDELQFSDALGKDMIRLCSAISIWETVAGLVRSYKMSVSDGRIYVHRFITEASFRYVPIGEREYTTAIDAYSRYGKGRHSARLNMGDCFAYACALCSDAKLMFKGEDFSKTDILSAL